MNQWRRRIPATGSKLMPWRERHVSLFTKSYPCNSIVFSAVPYPAQVSLFPRAAGDLLHRTWARFIWGSPWERTRRSNLFWRLEWGGLGLVNITLKMIVNRFLVFRDQGDSLVRAGFQSLGGGQLDKWTVTTSSNTGPWRRPGFCTEVAQAIGFLEGLFSWD